MSKYIKRSLQCSICDGRAIRNHKYQLCKICDFKYQIKKLKQEQKDFRKSVRTAMADYKTSEGCGCCRDYPAHRKHEEALAKLLNVPKDKDGFGYDFYKFVTKKKRKKKTKPLKR